MEYCYSETESLWYGSWNRHVCRKRKSAADRHSRSTGVDPSRYQRCCSPSCLWSQAQRIHLNKIIIKIWVIDWQHVIDVSVCEVELRCLFFLSSWEQRLWILLRMSTEICRLGEGHNLCPFECRLSIGKPFPRRPRKCCRLETLAC